MEWIWEIPIRPGVSSIGYIAPGSKGQIATRPMALRIPICFRSRCRSSPRLSALAKDAPPERVAVTSFLCRTYMGVCGPNWIIIGEAASQSDPITGNGVTAAPSARGPRQAPLFVDISTDKVFASLPETAYSLRVSGVGRYFNSLIEKLFYESPVRARLGLFGIARAYTVPAWLTNVVYSRVRPRASLRNFGLLFCSGHDKGSGVGLVSTQPLVQPRSPTTHSKLSMEEGGSVVHCIHQGKGDAILFIHGMPTNHMLWGGIIQELSSCHRCFAVDLPGMGETPFIPYSLGYLDLLAKQIELLRMQHGIKKWHVVGHDAGSAIAVQYAARFSQHVACLALMSPAIFPDLKPFYLLNALRKPLLGELLAPLLHLAFWQIAMRRALVGESNNALHRAFYEPFSGLTGAWQLMRLVRWGKPQDMLGEIPTKLAALLMPTLLFPRITRCFARLIRRASSFAHSRTQEWSRSTQDTLFLSTNRRMSQSVFEASLTRIALPWTSRSVLRIAVRGALALVPYLPSR